MPSIRVALLTVSDTAFASSDPAALDRSGPALRTLLEGQDGRFSIVATALVPDEPAEIQRAVHDFCDSGAQLVLTTGGTGFGVRDSTPEALSELIDKPAPGLVTLMLTSSLKITPLAALARPVAGVHLNKDGRGTLLVSLPGSPKGATENLEALLGILPHAVELASGGSGKETHAAMGVAPTASSAEHSAPAVTTSTSSHQHHHHHHHHHGGHSHHAPTPRALLSLDPSISVAQRQRQSPYSLVPSSDAISLILSNTSGTHFTFAPVGEALLGHVLAEDVYAPHNIPKGPTTNVDGYALRASDPAGTYPVVLTFPASGLPQNTLYRINTGAPLPPGADSVIMVEDTVVASRTADGEEQGIQTLAQVPLGDNVRDAGSDVREGEKVLERGDVISAVGGELGTLAFVGKKSVKVYRRPIVAVLSTGNELVNILDNPSATSPNPSSAFNSIPDSNRPSLISILQHLHFDVIDLGIVGDTMEATKKALKNGKEKADVVITTGGTSMGVGDLLKPCIERELGGTVHFGRVAMKPGKPTTFATLPPHPFEPNQTPKLVFALPGNPASALVTFFVFVLPALRKMEGRRESEWQLPRIPVQVSTDIHLDSRPEYHRVWLRPNRDYKSSGASLVATSTGGQRSSRTVSLAATNGLLELPAWKEGEEKVVKRGSVVECVIVGDLGS